MRSSILFLLANLFVMQPLAMAEEKPETLTLAELLSAALEHDGRVLAAHAELDAYRAKYDEARWLWFPVFKLQALVGGPVSERRLACDPDTDPGCTGLEVTEASKQGDFDLGRTGLALGGKLEGYMPIYTFGKISEAKRAAMAGIDVSEAGIDRARQAVALEVRRAYYGWLLASNSVDVLEEGDKKIKKAEEKLLKMLEELNEDVTDRDLFKLRYYASKIRTMLATTRSGQAVALAALRFLTGIEELGTQVMPAYIELEAPDYEERAREDYLAQAQRKRPELRMLRAGTEARRAQVELQKSSFYPDFFLGGYVKGSWTWVQDFVENPLLNQGLTNYDAALAIGFRVTFDIPQKLARLEQAEANLRRMQAQAEQAEQAIGLEIDKRIEEFRTAVADRKIKKRGHRAAKAWMRANWMSYGVGISDTKDLLDSIAAYASSKIEMDKVHHDILLAIDHLRMTTGDDLTRTDGREDGP